MKEAAPEARAGQHVMAGFEGTDAPASLIERVRAGRIGGVILFKRNIESAGQTAALIASLQDAALASPLEAPLLVGIDQEGGRVSRLSDDFTTFPAARGFGDAGDATIAREAARITGAELEAVGVNVNFAPVLDILTNPECAVIGDRAFGESSDVVGRMGEAVTQGMQETGVAACAKHFPGIGDMAPDPHDVLPASRLTLDELRAREMRPFQHLIRRTPPACVMTAHAVFEAIDDASPASLSPVFLQEILRGELGFRGVAITDDLDMGAIDDPAEAALHSILAGADIALICHSEDAQERACSAISDTIRNGSLPPEQEAASSDRIRRLKESYCRPNWRAEMLEIIGCEEHREARERILAAIGEA
ncbi:MAG: beta-N-acetylhexosaminidase [Nitrospinae bacterium]|nr:beta-N-acetylhexosaminidase [Nitrospinota bacterium]